MKVFLKNKVLFTQAYLYNLTRKEFIIMKKVLSVLVLFLFSVCFLTACKKNSDDVVKLGVVSNLSVAAQFYGEEVVNGYKLCRPGQRCIHQSGRRK